MKTGLTQNQGCCIPNPPTPGCCDQTEATNLHKFGKGYTNSDFARTNFCDILDDTNSMRDEQPTSSDAIETRTQLQAQGSKGLLSKGLRALRDFVQPPYVEKPDVLMHVTNVTRSTVIATGLEVANTSAKRRKGLLGRTELRQGGGLWISPCESVHTVGMQFPIDLLYLDRANRVKKVKQKVGPWRVSACFTAHSIIELPAGSNAQSGTKAGDMLEFSPAAHGSR